ncbi:MAG: hypothetical protein LBP42_05765 [Treponema sp.]|jgi:hypothetical protein|nr:hypothetical protein [Treponema sp.]
METLLNKRKELVEKKRWQGKWVYSNSHGTGPHYIMFRKGFSLEESPAAALLDITADRCYKLYVNGIFTAEGPVPSGYHYWSYDTWDIRSRLKPGANVIAVLAAQWDPAPGKPASLLAQLNLKIAAGEYVIGTGGDWKTRPAAGWCHEVPPVCWIGHRWARTGFVEVRDIGADDENWIQPDYDDSHWSPAGHTVFNSLFFKTMETGVHSGPLRCLVKRDIPPPESVLVKPRAIVNTGEVKGTEVLCAKNQMKEFQWAGLDDIEPASHAAVENTGAFLAGTEPLAMRMVYQGEIYGRILWQPAAVLDFGELLNAYIQLDLSAPRGTIIDVSYGQTFHDRKVRHYTGGIYRLKRFILREGRQQIESFDYASCRFVQITVVESSGPVYLYGAALRSVRYPVEKKAAFSCSDALVERVWHAHDATSRLCVVDMYMDNTWREKNGWGGDCTLNILATLTHYGNVDIIRRYFRMFIYSQHPWGGLPATVPENEGDLVDHQLSYVIRICEYYWFTGDRVLIEELYSGLRRFMEYMERFEAEDGFLYDTAGALHIDWTSIDLRMPSVTVNFQYYLAMTAMMKLAGEFGHGEDREVFAAKIAALGRTLGRFWDEERGAFPDSIADDAFVISEDTNALALLADCVSPEQKKRILEKVFCYGYGLEGTIPVVRSSPSFAYYVMLALCRTGRYGDALEYIRKRYGSAFDQGLDTIPEAWVFNPRGEMSAAQATLPASYILTTEILGLRPLRGNRLLVEPHPGDLTGARGSVLLPCGEASLSWTKGDVFTAELKLPPGAEAVFRMPGKTLSWAQKNRSLRADAGGILELILPPGDHSLSVTV